VTGEEKPMRQREKPTKAKVEAKLPIARKSRKSEGSRVWLRLAFKPSW
jgi:hypothetical protein